MAEPNDAGELDRDADQTTNIAVYLAPEPPPNALTFTGQCTLPPPPPPTAPSYSLNFDVHVDAPNGSAPTQTHVSAAGCTFDISPWKSATSNPTDCPLAGYIPTTVTPWPGDQPITVTIIYSPEPKPR
jgi:hypothetical protein